MRQLLALERNNGIIIDVTHINSATMFQNLGMFFDDQPTHMWEKKTFIWIMRISIGVRVLVMTPVISDPLVNWIL